MNLRPVTMDDAETLFAWRNDPLTREMSISTDEVSWADHLQWLLGSLENPSRKLFIAEQRGTPVGTIRIDNDHELSWTVAPEYRGRKFGKRMVASVAKPGHIARIKRTNIGSQHIAGWCGFTLVRDGDLQEWVKALPATSDT